MADLLNLGAVYATMEMRMKDWNKSTAAAKKDLTGMRSFALRNETAITKMSRSFAIAGTVIAAAIGFAAKKSIEFNKEIANIATLMPTATTEILELKKNIQGLGIQYGKDTIDLAKGAYQVVSAFGEQAASSKKLEIATIAATAGMSTTSDAINLLSAVSKGYNTTSDEQIQKISDLAFQTVRLGQTTFPELAASIGRVVPTAATLGVGVEELNAIFATLTGVTGSAAEVSTQTSGILRAMIKPTAGMRTAMKDLGFETGEQMLKSMGLVESLNALVGTTDGTTISVGKLFGRAEAMTALFALTGTQAETFGFKLGEMGNASGLSAKALGAVTDGVNKAGFQFEQTKQRVTVLVQTIGDSFLPILSAMMSAVTPVLSIVQYFAEVIGILPGPLKLLVGGLVALTATTLLVTAAGMKLTLVWAKIPPKITAAVSAMGPWIAIIGGAVLAIGILRKAIANLGKSYDAAMAKIKESAAKEKTIQDKLIAYRKQAKGKELELLIESNNKMLSLENNSREVANEFPKEAIGGLSQFLEPKSKSNQGENHCRNSSRIRSPKKDIRNNFRRKRKGNRRNCPGISIQKRASHRSL